MPQLDIGIFLLESFINTLIFWYIYLYKAFLIFPHIMKIIKFRISNLKLFYIKIWYFIFKLSIIIKIRKLTRYKFNNIIINILIYNINMYNKMKFNQVHTYYIILSQGIFAMLFEFNFKYLNNKLIRNK